MVTFVLPTAKESDWVQTGRSFNAMRWYKEHKKGIGKMKTITVTVQVRDDVEIDSFLQTLIDKFGDSKVIHILSLKDSLVKDGDRCEKLGKLGRLKQGFRTDTNINHQLSKWLEDAEQKQSLLIISSSDETEKEAIAIAAAVQAPNDKDQLHVRCGRFLNLRHSCTVQFDFSNEFFAACR
jgi:hypothetical protein